MVKVKNNKTKSLSGPKKKSEMMSVLCRPQLIAFILLAERLFYMVSTTATEATALLAASDTKCDKLVDVHYKSSFLAINASDHQYDNRNSPKYRKMRNLIKEKIKTSLNVLSQGRGIHTTDIKIRNLKNRDGHLLVEFDLKFTSCNKSVPDKTAVKLSISASTKSKGSVFYDMNIQSIIINDNKDGTVSSDAPHVQHTTNLVPASFYTIARATSTVTTATVTGNITRSVTHQLNSTQFNTSSAIPVPAAEGRCVTGIIPGCANMGYNSTYYPNWLGHKSQREAAAAMNQFEVLITLFSLSEMGDAKCHPHLMNFTCFSLQPPCDEDLQAPVTICPHFCNDVKRRCKLLDQTLFWDKMRCDGFFDNISSCLQVCPPSSNFTCNQSRLCIPINKTCDGALDCGPNDFSDEIGCDATTNTTTDTDTNTDATQTTNTSYIVISATEEENTSVTTNSTSTFDLIANETNTTQELINQLATSRTPLISSTNYIPTSVPVPTRTTKESRCVPIKMEHCINMGYTTTYYPNWLGHKSQEEASAALSYFQELENSQCHPHSRNFTCFFLQPPCDNKLQAPVSICSHFCRDVSRYCADNFGNTTVWNKIQKQCDSVSRNQDSCFQVCPQSTNFTCNQSRLCIPISKTCDGAFDCGPNDVSDECSSLCGKTTNPAVTVCSSTDKCINQHKLCDGKNDCGDWEDERDCTCTKGFKKCATTGQCIREGLFCNYEFDCDDKSDEKDCPCDLKYNFRCVKGGYCKNTSAKCNGINDCGDYSDEFDCGSCSDQEFRCDKYLCKSYIKHWCNHRIDCLDKADEPDDCKCKEYQFRCDNGQCIPIFQHCDGRPQCDDNSDEKDCPSGCKNKSDQLYNYTCFGKRFQCPNGLCIPLSSWCDGNRDCSDGADEPLNCSRTCSSYLRAKEPGKAKLHICNGQIDCPNGEDEKYCLLLSINVPVDVRTFTEDTREFWKYNRNGFLYVNYAGSWHTVCGDDYNQMSKDNLTEFGQGVCKIMQQQSVSEIYIVKDKASVPGHRRATYYRNITSVSISKHQYKSTETLCPNRHVILINCSDPECGNTPAKRIKTPTSRIVGGETAEFGSWPFYAAIYIDQKHWCGGTIIDQEFILTAAHCFLRIVNDTSYRKPSVIIRNDTDLGKDDFSSFRPTKPIVVRVGISKHSSLGPFDQWRRVSFVIKHSMFDSSSRNNDIALLRLDSPLNFTPYTLPVCLPATDSFPSSNDQNCFAIGMGSLGWNQCSPDELQQVKLPVNTSAECQKIATINWEHKIVDSQICAGYSAGDKDTCKGDSGGPLVCEDQGKWTVVGVTSYSYSCAKRLTPGVYTKVSKYLQWIKGVIAASFEPYPELKCPFGQTPCQLTTKCIPNDKQCDGQKDCEYGEDEFKCNSGAS